MLNVTHAVQMQPTYRCAPGSPVLARWEQWRLSPPTGPSDRYLVSLWGREFSISYLYSGLLYSWISQMACI